MLKFSNFSLRTKLLLGFGLVLIIPLVIITGYALDQSSRTVIDLTTEQELNAADRSAEHVQAFLVQMKSDLLFLHNDPGTKDFAAVLAGENNPAALPDIEDLFINFLTNSTQGYKDIRVLDATGQEVVRVDTSDGSPKIAPTGALENKSGRPYFKEAAKLQPDQVYFSGLDLNVTQGQISNPPLPVLRYSIPLYAENGQFVGVLVLKALAEPLLDGLIADEVDEQTYLIDSKGDYWLNPDASKLYGSLLGTGAGFASDQPHDAAYMQQNEQGVLQASPDRPDGFQTFVRIPLEDEPGTYWTLVNVRPESEILGQVNQARRNILILVAVVSLITIAIALSTAYGILRPVAALTNAAKQISQGRWDTPLPETESKDEVGELTTSFNTMVQTVRDRNTQLTKVNESLTAQKTELTRANAIARESIRLKSEFMSTMSHELRTPLNAILGFSGIMLSGMGGEIDEEAQHMIERIESNSNRLLHLINDVLDLAKIEAGRMELTSQPFSPHVLVDRWSAEVGVLANKKALKLKINVDPNLPDKLIGDPERITQIAINLLSNAFKFTEKGTVTLDVDKQDTTWTIRVTDTGIGIPPHALGYIFDEFRQVDGTSTRAFGGSGLGLSITRNICRMMDGTVQVTSELGKGSVFTVTLPLNIANTEQQASISAMAV